LTSRKPAIAGEYIIVPAEGGLFSPVVMRVIAIANDGVQKRAQDSHSAFNEEKRFEPEVDAVAKNADEDGNCDWKYHEQPDVVEHSDQLLMGHV
jgi:hypothetical protein